MEKKNNGFLIGQTIIIILLIVVIIILVMGGNKKNGEIKNKDNINNSETTTKSEDIALDDPRFEEIYHEIYNYLYDKNRSEGYKSFSDTELLLIAATEFKDADFKKLNETNEYGDNYYTIDKNIIINYLKKYFGSDVKLKNEKLEPSNSSIMSNTSDEFGCGIKFVSDEGDKYKVDIYDGCGIGYNGLNVSKTKLVSATLVGNEIVLKEKAIYYNSEYENEKEYIATKGGSPLIYHIYSDVNKTNEIDTKRYKNHEESVNATVTVEDYLDKASTIIVKFAYNKDTDSYYFKSSKIEQ